MATQPRCGDSDSTAHTKSDTRLAVASLKMYMQWAGHACDEADEACGGNGANTHILRRRPVRMATQPSGGDSDSMAHT